jgi:hypothetical protein
VIWRGRDISRSMVALVTSLAALALLGVATRAPAWFGQDQGVDNVPPGLLTVMPSARGVATLGGGVSVSLYPDGMRITRGTDLLLQTVVGGSVLSGVVGRVSVAGTDVSETVQRHIDNLVVDDLVFLPGQATYFGRVYDSGVSLPVTITVQLAGSFIRIGASVIGADAVVWHLARETRTFGIPPALGPVILRGHAAWIAPDTPDGRAAFSTVLGTDVGAGPQRAQRSVDLRSAGRTDVHVWTDSGYLTVSSQARHLPTATTSTTS